MARAKRKAVVVFSGGLDSVCLCAHLAPSHSLYGITFSYGQRAAQEVRAAKRLARKVGLVEHRTVDIGFMRSLYAKTNVLTDPKKRLPSAFDYSIVVPVRNAVFLSIASAWAYTIGAQTVAYGAHTGDEPYPDCRPAFSQALEAALNLGESDGIRSHKRRAITILSPAKDGLSKADMIKKGYRAFGDAIFSAWSCYSSSTRLHCGACESCLNRRAAFAKSKIQDKTKYREPAPLRKMYTCPIPVGLD